MKPGKKRMRGEEEEGWDSERGGESARVCYGGEGDSKAAYGDRSISEDLSAGGRVAGGQPGSADILRSPTKERIEVGGCSAVEATMPR